MSDRYFLSQYLPTECLRSEVKQGFLVSCRLNWRKQNEIAKHSCFYFVLGGSCNLEIDGKQYTLHPGSLALLPGGKVINASHTEEKYLYKYWCEFSARIAGVSIFDWLQIPYVIQVDDMEQTESLFHAMLYDGYGQCYTVKSGVLRASEQLFSILDIFLEKTLQDREIFGNNRDLMKVILYMAEHMQEKLTVEDIAAIIYMSPAAFSRMFHKYVGMPPITFLNELRLDKAKKLLSETDISINQIAETVGFDDEFYFFKIFGRHVGVTPAVYRQKNNLLKAREEK